VGDEKRVRKLVAAGAKLDLVNSGGSSALRHASFIGHARIAKLLLDGKFEGKGAAIILQASYGYTALIRACMNRHEAVVRLLLERGADATLRTPWGDSARYSFSSPVISALLELQRARGACEDSPCKILAAARSDLARRRKPGVLAGEAALLDGAPLLERDLQLVLAHAGLAR
jgi:ankyrin repeat protein